MNMATDGRSPQTIITPEATPTHPAAAAGKRRSSLATGAIALLTGFAFKEGRRLVFFRVQGVGD